MYVLITGGQGMLAADVATVFNQAGLKACEYTHAELDVSDQAAVEKTVAAEKPDAVIHCAAFTNVDACQENPEKAYFVNTIGTINVAAACAMIDAAVLYISSCGVFDGQKQAPYNESDSPHPLTVYHRSKYLGEIYVRDVCSKYFIVRPGWLFGGHPAQKKNFVAARAREAAKSDKMVSASDKFGSPTYTLDLARTLLELIQSSAYGLYHAANTGMASRYDYVSEILHQLGLSNEVQPVTSDYFPRSASVPNYEALDNLELRSRGFTPMRPWKDALGEYICNQFRNSGE